MFIVFLKGFLVGCGLIIAIGAQNAFVLSQGVKKKHYLIIPTICGFCDGALIFLGVTGIGTIVSSDPHFSIFAAVFGAIFLFWYGLNSFRSAIKGGSLQMDSEGSDSLKTVLLTTLGVTLLNPHVYLDTVVLVGSISSQFKEHRYLFGFGAASASFIWFFSLSLGGKMLSPVFKKPMAWKILDTFVGVTMWWIAATLLVGVLV
jgi:L-lysine exporter family protein LysE/ArgO